MQTNVLADGLAKIAGILQSMADELKQPETPTPQETEPPVQRHQRGRCLP